MDGAGAIAATVVFDVVGTVLWETWVREISQAIADAAWSDPYATKLTWRKAASREESPGGGTGNLEKCFGKVPENFATSDLPPVAVGSSQPTRRAVPGYIPCPTFLGISRLHS